MFSCIPPNASLEDCILFSKTKAEFFTVRSVNTALFLFILFFSFGLGSNILAQTTCDCDITNPEIPENSTFTFQENATTCFTESRSFDNNSQVIFSNNSTLCISEGVEISIPGVQQSSLNTTAAINIFGSLIFRGDLQLNNDVSVFVGSEGSFSVGNLTFNGAGANALINDGTVELSVLQFQGNSSDDTENVIDNRGSMTVSSNIEMVGTSGANFIRNQNEMVIGSNFNLNQESILNNCGILSSGTGFNLNGGELINTGEFNVTAGTLNFGTTDSEFSNFGLVEISSAIENLVSQSVLYNEGEIIVTEIAADGVTLTGPTAESGNVGFYRVSTESSRFNRSTVEGNLDFTRTNLAPGSTTESDVFVNSDVELSEMISFGCESSGTCSGPIISGVPCFNPDGTPNTFPFAVTDNYETDQGVSIIIDPLANDSDAQEDDVIEFLSINNIELTGDAQIIAVPDGMVEILGNGALVFVPDNDFIGSSTFNYQITDNSALDSVSTGQIEITVNEAVDVCDPEASGNSDFDNDGIADICDLDDDNDGILDIIECTESTLVLGENLVINPGFEDGYFFWTSDLNRGENCNTGNCSGTDITDTSGNCRLQGWVAVSPFTSLNGSCDEYYSYNGGEANGSVQILDENQTGNNVYNDSEVNDIFICSGYTNGIDDSEIAFFNELRTDNTRPTADEAANNSLYVDSADLIDQDFWIEEITVEANTFYYYSAYIMVIEEDPILSLAINGISQFTENLDRITNGAAGSNEGSDDWQLISVVWNSGEVSGSIPISIRNNALSCGGNDIRVDDITFAPITGSVIPCFNLDSDEDGCNDVTEAGHIDNGSGQVEGTINEADGTVIPAGLGTAYTGTNISVTTFAEIVVEEEPEDVSVANGVPANFTSTSSAGTQSEGLVYSWFVSTDSGETFSSEPIANTANLAIGIDNDNYIDGYIFRLEISHPFNVCDIPSFDVGLRIIVPIAVEDNYRAKEETELIISPLSNDENPFTEDNSGLEIVQIGGDQILFNNERDFITIEEGTIQVTDENNDGIVDLADTITFTPVEDFLGTAVFSYTITDGINTAEGEITIVVTPILDLLSVDISEESLENIDHEIDLSSQLTEVPVGVVTYSIVDGLDSGFFTINEDGVVTLTARDFENPLDSDEDNIYEVEIMVTDEDRNVGTSTISVFVCDHNLYFIDIVCIRISWIFKISCC